LKSEVIGDAGCAKIRIESPESRPGITRAADQDKQQVLPWEGMALKQEGIQVARLDRQERERNWPQSAGTERYAT